MGVLEICLSGDGEYADVLRGGFRFPFVVCICADRSQSIRLSSHETLDREYA
jgi:hypothetical protein